MRRRILSVFVRLAATHVALSTPAFALTADKTDVHSHVRISNGEVALGESQKTTLKMFLPSSGMLGGAKTNRVIGAQFSRKSAGTSLTAQSNYSAKNAQALRSYLSGLDQHQAGSAGSLGRHWANEQAVFYDVRNEYASVLPTLALESLHSFGLEREVSNGLNVGFSAQSKNQTQSLRARINFTHRSVTYSGSVVQTMFGQSRMRSDQQLRFSLGGVTLDSKVTMLTLENGSIQTFPQVQASFALKGVQVRAEHKREEQLHVFGAFVDTSALELKKSIFENKAQLFAKSELRSADGMTDFTSGQLGFAYAPPHSERQMGWSVRAVATYLSGGQHQERTRLLALQDDRPTSLVGRLQADIKYAMSKKTQLNFRGQVNQMWSTLGSFSRASVKAMVKHGLWDFEAMAGYNRAPQNVNAFALNQSGLHYRFAQQAFGQFTQQRALFSLKVKYSY